MTSLPSLREAKLSPVIARSKATKQSKRMKPFSKSGPREKRILRMQSADSAAGERLLPLSTASNAPLSYENGASIGKFKPERGYFVPYIQRTSLKPGFAKCILIYRFSKR